MKVWDLEKEFDEFLVYAIGGREKKRQNTRSVVEKVRDRLLAKGEEALIEFSTKWDGWPETLDLKLTQKEIISEASKISKRDLAIIRGMIKKRPRLPQEAGLEKTNIQKEGPRCL